MIQIQDTDFINSYTIKQELSRSFGSQTFLIQRHYDQKLQVAKAFDLSKIPDLNYLKRTLDLITAKNFPFIVPYTSYVEDSQKILLIRDYLSENDLTSALNSNINMNALWRSIFQCYAILHENEVSPNNIKPSNIYFDKDLKVYLVDVMPLENSQFSPAATPETNKFLFYAPEYFTSQYPLSEKSDVWSLGTLMLYTYGYNIPWSSHNIFAMIKRMKDAKIPSDVPEMIRKTVSRMLIYEPSKRASILQLLRAHSLPVGNNKWSIIKKPTLNKNPALLLFPRTKLSKINTNVRSAKMPPVPKCLVNGAYLMGINDIRRQSYTARMTTKQLENHKLIDDIFE
ncbi:AGC family protein kinase [Tritrichomonas foetus]|uniref:AGC family protein kinase n=1 Tax=Tritrichomonas foetus TaxID=1144522 RepID=A0A1J4JPT6_9EUKA|nr:AGC family protein kinase [Tritrichomonas foetus]|eukprot:OHT01051.1 AGC family protein kinase [Tritrichomonas foetus]